MDPKDEMVYTAAVPNLFGTRDRFPGRQFFHGRGRGAGGGRMVQAVMRVMGSYAEQQMKLNLLTRRSLPALQTGS